MQVDKYFSKDGIGNSHTIYVRHTDKGLQVNMANQNRIPCCLSNVSNQDGGYAERRRSVKDAVVQATESVGDVAAALNAITYYKWEAVS